MNLIAKELKTLSVILGKKDINGLVFDFLKKNPNPKDSDVHAFAEKEKLAVDSIETAVYKLATKFVIFMSNGRSIEKGLTEKDVDPEQLKKGIKIEQEHIKDPEVTKKIALDHLAEMKNYYDLLEKMEKEQEK